MEDARPTDLPLHLRLRAERRRQGISQRAAARACDYSRESVSHYESGKGYGRSFSPLLPYRLARLLGVKITLTPSRSRRPTVCVDELFGPLPEATKR